MSDIVQKLWGFCHTLRHDGVDYGDYIEQITYLLFLKMADERAAVVPKSCDWNSLKNLSGTALTDHYADILRKLREAGGLLADIFAQATPRFNKALIPCEFIAGRDLLIHTATFHKVDGRWKLRGVRETMQAYSRTSPNQAPSRTKRNRANHRLSKTIRP